MADLSGKIVLITAAAQGIGLASVHAFVAAGAKVIATDINEAKLRELDGTPNVTTRVLSVLDADAVNQAVKALAIARGYLARDGIDIVFTPFFTEVDIDGQERTAVRFAVEPRP